MHQQQEYSNVPDSGEPICYKFNRGEKCEKRCRFVHVCQKCLSSKHGSHTCSQGGGGGKGKKKNKDKGGKGGKGGKGVRKAPWR